MRNRPGYQTTPYVEPYAPKQAPAEKPSKTVNELHAELQAARGRSSFMNRLRWACAVVSTLLFLCIPGGVVVGTWTRLHHLDLTGTVVGMILMGVFLGMPLVPLAAYLSLEVSNAKETVLSAEAKYHAAIQKQMEQKA